MTLAANRLPSAHSARMRLFLQPHPARSQLIIAGFLSLTTAIALGADLKEHQTDLRIEVGQDAGQIVTLSCRKDCAPFKALFISSRAPVLQGGAVLLPDLGNAPDTAIVTGPLRTGLPVFGWSTLTLPTPTASEGQATASLDTMQAETGARLGAALEFLKDRGLRNNAIIAHGRSAAVATAAIAKSPALQETINAVINVGFYTSETHDKKIEYLSYLEQLPFYVLDIYSDRGMPETVYDAPLRAKAAQPAGMLKPTPDRLPHTPKVLKMAFKKHGNLRFRQIQFEGTDHRMLEKSSELLKTVRGWLRIYAAGQEIQVK